VSPHGGRCLHKVDVSPQGGLCLHKVDCVYTRWTVSPQGGLSSTRWTCLHKVDGDFTRWTCLHKLDLSTQGGQVSTRLTVQRKFTPRKLVYCIPRSSRGSGRPGQSHGSLLSALAWKWNCRVVVWPMGGFRKWLNLALEGSVTNTAK
jgi:hypothetical protein